MYGFSNQGLCLVVFLYRILWSLTSKENPPTYCLISCEAKGVVYYQNSEYRSSDQGLCLIVFLHRILWSLTLKENPLTCCLIKDY